SEVERAARRLDGAAVGEPDGAEEIRAGEVALLPLARRLRELVALRAQRRQRRRKRAEAPPREHLGHDAAAGIEDDEVRLALLRIRAEGTKDDEDRENEREDRTSQHAVLASRYRPPHCSAP